MKTARRTRMRKTVIVGLASSSIGLVILFPAGVASAARSSSHAKHLVSASLRLDWLPEGYQAPFYVALHDGYYKAHGIKLSIQQGSGSGSTVADVAAGKVTFGFASIVAAGLANPTAGNSLLNVCGILQKNPQAVISLKSDPITKPDQLYTKLVGVPGGGQVVPFSAFEGATHVDPTRVKTVTLEAGSEFAALASGRVNAILDWGFADAPIVNEKKAVAPYLAYSQYGLDILTSSILVTRHTATAHAAVVRGFVAATAEGIRASVKNPKAAVDIMRSYQPTLTMKLAEPVMRGAVSYFHTPNSASHPYCWVSPKDLATSDRLLHKYGSLPKGDNLSAMSTNKFVAS